MPTKKLRYVYILVYNIHIGEFLFSLLSYFSSFCSSSSCLSSSFLYIGVAVVVRVFRVLDFVLFLLLHLLSCFSQGRSSFSCSSCSSSLWFLFFFLSLLSPWYDLRGWLGVKQQLSIYLVLVLVLLTRLLTDFFVWSWNCPAWRLALWG